ncbi:MAG: YbjN domain-containing protein [Polyangia bacterium]
MTLTAERVEEFLKGDGWPVERVDRNTWRSGFRGDVNSFRFYVRLTDNWIFFTIVPFVVAPRSSDHARELYRHLLRLNREINLAKFAIDDDDDVVLTVELPIEDAGDASMKDALEAMAYYADRHYLEVLTIAQQGKKAS